MPPSSAEFHSHGKVRVFSIDKDGWIESAKVCREHRPAIEHGALGRVNAIVLHRTGGGTARSTLDSWEKRSEGTHFLISESGEIFQCASLKKRCWHVGKLYSRCRQAESCTREEAKIIEELLRTKGASWGKKFKLVTEHELKKPYPERFPHNHDSLGIEVVGAQLKGKPVYGEANKEQQDSLFWLLDALVSQYSLGIEHIYAHGDIAHKEPTEGVSVLKAYHIYKGK